MQFSENEKRMIYQLEGTSQSAVLQEVHRRWRSADSQEMCDTAETVLRKLRALPERACMDAIREIQRTYRLPKARTISELSAGRGSGQTRKSCPVTTSWTWSGSLRTPGT